MREEQAHSARGLAFRVMVWAAALCGSCAATAQMQPPGSIAVNERGAATYSIPISAPSGLRGVEPRLELAFNSQRGNGLLGVGWSLSGLSIVGRCPLTVAQDAVRVNAAVNFNTGDRFCLDGQRLMVVSGNYGAASRGPKQGRSGKQVMQASWRLEMRRGMP